MLVITGASGLLGANLVLHARERGIDVVAVSHRAKLRALGLRSMQVDLAEPGAAEDHLRDPRPDWIVHCAAATNVDWCEAHPEDAYRLNAEMPRHLARFARACGARLVYISTDSVFDGTRGGYAEMDREAPVNEYSRSKLAGEIAIREELRERCLVVRTNFYGWNMQPKESLAEWILHRLEAGQEVTGFTDVVFTPISVNDLGDAILDMIDRGLSDVYHVAGSEATSKYDFAVQLAEVFGLNTGSVRPGSVRNSHLRAPRPLDTSLATDKITLTLGRPMPDVRSGLLRFRELRVSGFVERLARLGGAGTDREVRSRGG